MELPPFRSNLFGEQWLSIPRLQRPALVGSLNLAARFKTARGTNRHDSPDAVRLLSMSASGSEVTRTNALGQRSTWASLTGIGFAQANVVLKLAEQHIRDGNA